MTNILVNEINIKIENATIDDLNSITELEAICFLPSEAASKQSFKRRIERFPESFFVAIHNDKIIGVVNGCMTNSEVIFDEMYHDDKHHIPNGNIQTVFGLLVHPDYRRKGIGLALLNYMIDTSKKRGKQAVILTCKDYNVHYYEKFGFEKKGLSASTHGGSVWYDMFLKL